MVWRQEYVHFAISTIQNYTFHLIQPYQIPKKQITKIKKVFSLTDCLRFISIKDNVEQMENKAYTEFFRYILRFRKLIRHADLTRTPFISST